MSGVAIASVLVLTEDGADDAHETLAALARKVFRLVDGSTQTHRIRLEPPDTQASRVVRGNLWKSENPRDGRARRDLIGYIATKLLEGPRSFVLFHVDGDRPWSRREDSENVRKFERFIAHDIPQYIAAQRARRDARGSHAVRRLSGAPRSALDSPFMKIAPQPETVALLRRTASATGGSP